MLISRQTFFARPERAFPQVSANGNHIAYLAYKQNNAQIQLLQRSANWKDEDIVIHVCSSPAVNFFWSLVDHILLVMEQSIEEAHTCLYAVDIRSGESRLLADELKGRMHLLEHSYSQPGELLLGSNHRDPHWFDVYRLDINKNKTELVYENNRFSGFLAEDRCLKLAVADNATGGNEYFITDDENDWRLLFQVGAEDAQTTTPLCINSSQNKLFLTDSREHNTSVLSAMDINDGSCTIMAENKLADIEDTLVDKYSSSIDAVSFNHVRKQWQAITRGMEADLAFLEDADRGDLAISSRTRDKTSWVVGYARDDQPNTYYVYERSSKSLQPLFSNISEFKKLSLRKMHHQVTRSPDNKYNIVSYYTMPDKNSGPVPLVVLVHGGPWARDKWGYNPWHQWLANRGYAVLSVNFRGSTGFGKAFMNAGDRQWGGSMIDDIHAAIDDFSGDLPIDKNRVGVMGTSYGGFAALMLVSRYPDYYACAIDIFGPTNLVNMIESIPPQWQSQRDMLVKRVGDPDTETGRQSLNEQSPVTHIDAVNAPLLIVEGFQDPRVDHNGIRDYAMQFKDRNGSPLIHISFPDEGHNLGKEKNRLVFTAIAELFLQQYLDGECESFDQVLLQEVAILSGSDLIQAYAR
ncbi:MAG: alpha/beta fold hydrolase [Gammaproteobacteria bacterium]